MNKAKIPNEVIKLLSSEEIIKFKELQTKIQEINRLTNLTRLLKDDDYWISQVYDSVWAFKEYSQNNFDNKKFIDIGSGCGFPGLAYAITHPNSEVYLVDSSKKKTEALKEIIKNISLKNKIIVINDRIENIAHRKSFRNSFDIATVRAVSNPATVSEYMLPFLIKNGFGFLFCGNWEYEDNKNLEKTLQILKGKIIERKKIYLPKQKGIRNIVMIRPNEICPEIYPRSVGKPEKYPIKG